ncbi:hypothetical protein P9112_012257 [Eukaryota sp. TZLM1-RC]
MLSIVSVCKGIHDSSVANWKASLNLTYNGILQHIFVVESDQDPAYSQLHSLCESHQNARLVIAGLSFHNAQKIHNQLCGVAECSPRSEFVLFVDDDIKVHQGVLEELVASFDDPKVLAATGYCFELPTQFSEFWGLPLMIYRLLNLGSFSGQRPKFMWGGFMMFNLDTFRLNLYNIVDVWRNGGYSDDMATVAITEQYGRTIASCSSAIFPNVLSKRISFANYFDFISRQLFVCLTYSSLKNRLQNLCLLVLNPLSFIGFGLPVVLSMCFGVYYLLALALPSIPLIEVPLSFTISCIFLSISLVVITSILISLVKTLSNGVSGAAENNEDLNYKLPFFATMMALIVHLKIAAFASIYVSFKKTIKWAGVIYKRRKGRIVEVKRPGYNVSANESLKQTLINDSRKGLVVGGRYPKCIRSNVDSSAGIGRFEWEE